MDLSEADGGEQAVADALSAFRVGRIAAFLFVQFNGLGRAAVANFAVFLSVKLAEVTEVAYSLSPGFDFGFRDGTGHFEDLEGEAGRGCGGVGEDLRLARDASADNFGFDAVGHAGFFTEGKGSSDLDALSAFGEGF
jgi:hypothetical protein